MINELAGWDQVSAAMAQAARSASGRVVLASNHYSLCGRLLFETHDTPAVYCPTARRSAFGFFDRQEPPADATVVVLTSDIHEELPAGLTGQGVLARRPGRDRARRPARRPLLRPLVRPRAGRRRRPPRRAVGPSGSDPPDDLPAPPLGGLVDGATRVERRDLLDGHVGRAPTGRGRARRRTARCARSAWATRRG